MQMLIRCVRVSVFLAMLGFALSNSEPARLRFFGIPEFEWRAPLVLWLLLFFMAGVCLGVAAMLPNILRQRRELASVRRSGQERGREMADPRWSGMLVIGLRNQV
jgi:uncharacterized integral membrane protein